MPRGAERDPARRMNYYEWKESDIACTECGWSGKGDDAELGEMFAEGAEFHCPQCDHRFGFVPFPTIDETLSDSRSDRTDRKIAEIRLARFERFKPLSSADQLPDLDPIPQTLTWDIITDPGGENCVVILNGEQEIWRELCWWEDYRRFAEVAKILSQKYGKTLRDLVPTRRSKDDLYGDRISSIGYVDRVRQALARGEMESIDS